MTSPRPLEVAIEIAASDWTSALPDAEALAARALTAAFHHAAPAGAAAAAEVSLVLAGDDMVAELNKNYRGKDGPTNVLSFAMHEDDGQSPVSGQPDLLGDVVVAFGVSEREARDQGLPLADHLSHLCVHGMLHLLGFDHEDEAEAERMEQLETRILGDLGVPDPYGKER